MTFAVEILFLDVEICTMCLGEISSFFSFF